MLNYLQIFALGKKQDCGLKSVQRANSQRPPLSAIPVPSLLRTIVKVEALSRDAMKPYEPGEHDTTFVVQYQV